MVASFLLAIVVPVVQPKTLPPLQVEGLPACPEAGAALTAAEPTEEFESKFRLVAKGREASSDDVNRELAKVGAVCDLALDLPKGGEVRLKFGDALVLGQFADENQRLRIVVNGETVTWFVRRVIDWKTSEGVGVGVRRLAGLKDAGQLRVDFSCPLGYELRQLVSWTAESLRPFTVKTAKDVEAKDLFKITFGKEAVTAEVPLPTCALKIPYAALKEKGGEATLDYDGVKWTLLYGDQRDVDFVKRPVVVADNAAVAAFPKQDLPAQPDAKPIVGPIQYWTPHDWNAWVGDCAAVRWGGRIHVFYLYDRRHHRSKAGGGGHYFAHISSEDLVHWTEHPDAVSPTRRWEYIGTGMPVDIGGKLHLFYGLHTDRYGRGWEKFPIGGTYAVSSDGIHFSKSDDLFMDDQNPSPFIRDDGRIGIVHSFCSTNAGEWVAETLKGPWTKLHDTIPTGGDCPFYFTWNGWRYVIQGFIGMAASQTGAAGTWADWVMSGDDVYDGLSVPVVAEFGKNRRILVGWIRHPDGWGGWLCFRELVQHADGKLGTKWADEIPPPEKPQVFDVAAGEPFARRFVRTDGEADELEFSVDPKAARVQFANVVGGKVPRIATLSERAQAASAETDYARYLKRYSGSPDQCSETAVGKVRGLDRPYRVRLVVHYDPKGDTTIFDAEVAGGRTLLCIRRGKWKGEGIQ